MAGLRIDSIAGTHVGLVRRDNEDRFLRRDEAGLWAVADGMGGHDGGEWAAQTIIDELQAVQLTGSIQHRADRLAEAIQDSNRRIMAEAARRGRAMGSTAVLLDICGDAIAVLWVGDSRAYRLRDGSLTRLTRDHSRVQELVDGGLLHPDDARHHPMSHILSRAVGIDGEVDADRIVEDLIAGDALLLCSDGLTGPVDERAIADALAIRPLERARDRLIELALINGAPDNVTVVLVAAEAVAG